MSEQHVILPGQRLRAEREARGMTEEEVARELNLTISFLKALEADDYERLPEATFIRGYIRNYARLLEMPSDDLASTFDEAMQDESADERHTHQQEVVRPRRRRSGLLGLMALAVLVLAALAYWLFAGSGEPEPATGAETQVESAAPSASPQMSESPQAVDEAAESSIAEPQTQTAGPTASDMTVATAEPEPADRLEVGFSDSCWVEVRNAEDEIIFSGQKQADERLSLEAAGPFRLKFGNAAAVSRITLNGDTVSLPSGTPGDVVRLTVP